MVNVPQNEQREYSLRVNKRYLYGMTCPDIDILKYTNISRSEGNEISITRFGDKFDGIPSSTITCDIRFVRNVAGVPLRL